MISSNFPQPIQEGKKWASLPLTLSVGRPIISKSQETGTYTILSSLLGNHEIRCTDFASNSKPNSSKENKQLKNTFLDNY